MMKKYLSLLMMIVFAWASASAYYYHTFSSAGATTPASSVQFNGNSINVTCTGDTYFLIANNLSITNNNSVYYNNDLDNHEISANERCKNGLQVWLYGQYSGHKHGKLDTGKWKIKLDQRDGNYYMTITKNAVYLRGEEFDWNIGKEFNDNNDGTFTLKVDKITAGKEFKIYDSFNDYWGWYGSCVEGKDYLEEYNSNIRVKQDMVNVTIVYSTTTKTFTFDGTVEGAGPVEYTKYYLRYDNTRYAEFITNDGDNYYANGVTLPADTKFKIANDDWSSQFTAAGNRQINVNTEYTFVDGNGTDNDAVLAEDINNGYFHFTVSSKKFKIDDTQWGDIYLTGRNIKDVSAWDPNKAMMQTSKGDDLYYFEIAADTDLDVNGHLGVEFKISTNSGNWDTWNSGVIGPYHTDNSATYVEVQAGVPCSIEPNPLNATHNWYFSLDEYKVTTDGRYDQAATAQALQDKTFTVVVDRKNGSVTVLSESPIIYFEQDKVATVQQELTAEQQTALMNDDIMPTGACYDGDTGGIDWRVSYPTVNVRSGKLTINDAEAPGDVTRKYYIVLNGTTLDGAVDALGTYDINYLPAAEEYEVGVYAECTGTASNLADGSQRSYRTLPATSTLTNDYTTLLTPTATLKATHLFKSPASTTGKVIYDAIFDFTYDLGTTNGPAAYAGYEVRRNEDCPSDLKAANGGNVVDANWSKIGNCTPLEGFYELTTGEPYDDATNNWSRIAVEQGHLPIHVHHVTHSTSAETLDNLKSMIHVDATIAAHYPFLECKAGPVVTPATTPANAPRRAPDATINADEYVLTKFDKTTTLQNIDLSSTGSVTTGVDDIAVDGGNDAPAEYYNLQGVRVDADNLVPGVYIRRQGSESSKVYVK